MKKGLGKQFLNACVNWGMFYCTQTCNGL